MPLRDHFDSPVNDRHSWDSFHAMWPANIVRQLFDILPAGYVSAPGVHFGKNVEIDIAAFENDGTGEVSTDFGSGGTATAAPPQPTQTLEADLSEQDEFEVRIYDTERQRELVAAIEIVSPANKDRPDHRRAFAAKVAALLQKGVCVSVVDLVTPREFNLYSELLDLIGRRDPTVSEPPQHLYAVTLRARPDAPRPLLDVWFYPMELGAPLPTLPVWLSPELRVLLPLEAGYEETCRLLHIA